MKYSFFVVVAVALCASAITLDDKFSNFKQKFLRYGLDVFNPAELPCAYTANYKLYVNNEGTEQTVAGYQAGYGRYASLYENGDNAGTPVDIYGILRLDIQKTGFPDSAAIIYGVVQQGMSVCQFDEYVENYEEGYKYVKLLDFALKEPFPYDTKKENVQYAGVVCTMYSINQQFSPTSSIYAELYASPDDYVVGMYMLRMEDAGKAVLNLTVSYDMTAYESQFMLDSSFQGCTGTNYSDIYSAPPKEPNCPIDPNPPSHF